MLNALTMAKNAAARWGKQNNPKQQVSRGRQTILFCVADTRQARFSASKTNAQIPSKVKRAGCWRTVIDVRRAYKSDVAGMHRRGTMSVSPATPLGVRHMVMEGNNASFHER